MKNLYAILTILFWLFAAWLFLFSTIDAALLAVLCAAAWKIAFSLEVVLERREAPKPIPTPERPVGFED